MQPIFAVSYLETVSWRLEASGVLVPMKMQHHYYLGSDDYLQNDRR